MRPLSNSNAEILGLFEKYSRTPPEGTWFGRLDYRAWGKSVNVWAFFTHIGTGDHYALSCFRERAGSRYVPQDGLVDFAAHDLEPGGVYRLTIGTTKKSRSAWLAAVRENDVVYPSPAAIEPNFCGIAKAFLKIPRFLDSLERNPLSGSRRYRLASDICTGDSGHFYGGQRTFLRGFSDVCTAEQTFRTFFRPQQPALAGNSSSDISMASFGLLNA